MDPHLKRGQKAFAGRGDIGARHRWFVSCSCKFEGPRLGVREDALAVHGDTVGVGEEAEVARFMCRGGDLGGGDGLESFLDRFHHFDGTGESLTGSFSARRCCTVDSAQQHLLAASAAGQQTHSDLDQAGVEFGVRLARRGVQ